MIRFTRVFCAFFLGCASVLGTETASGSLLQNGDFAAGLKFWKPNTWAGKSQVIIEKNDKGKSIVKIKTDDISGKANITQWLNSLDIPEGSSFKLSCRYRTEEMISGKGGGGYCFLQAKYKKANSDKFSGYQKIVLKPTKNWKYIESVKKFHFPVKNILLLAMTLNSKGRLYLKDISLELLSSKNEIALFGFQANAPLMDGNLDDSCWKKAQTAMGFCKLGKAEEAKPDTRVKTCYDSKNIYFGILAEEPLLESTEFLSQNIRAQGRAAT